MFVRGVVIEGGRTHNYAMQLLNTHRLRQEWGGVTGWDQYTLPIQDILYNRIWNMDKQFPDNCLAFGGITTGIQRLRHMMIFRISIGLSFGTSNPDTWRLKLSTRCQLLVDHSELCTNVIFNFSQLILEASARKKEKKKKRKKEARAGCRAIRGAAFDA